MGKPKLITKKDLIVSAKKQIIARGQGKVTLKNVAESAGVTQGVVYYHFKTKDQLLSSLLMDVTEGLQHQMASIQEGKKSPDAQLKAYVSEEMYKIQTGSDQHQLWMELGSLSLHNREMKRIMGRAILDRIGKMSEWTNGDAAAGRLLAAVLDGLAFQALFDPSLKEKEVHDCLQKWISLLNNQSKSVENKGL